MCSVADKEDDNDDVIVPFLTAVPFVIVPFVADNDNAILVLPSSVPTSRSVASVCSIADETNFDDDVAVPFVVIPFVADNNNTGNGDGVFLLLGDDDHDVCFV